MSVFQVQQYPRLAGVPRDVGPHLHDTRGSAATDWNDIGDRINFIVDLFRTRHHDPNLLRPPFTAAEQARILALGSPRASAP